MGFVFGLYQIKMVSLFYDIFYLLCGITAMIVGSQIKDDNNQPSLQPSLNGVGTCLVIFGLITFVVAIVGSFSVIKDNKKALYVFGTALALLIAIKIIVGSVVLIYLSDAVQATKNNLAHKMNLGKEAINEIDYIQRTYECCGYDGPSFWASSEEDLLPQTCCPEEVVAVECSFKLAYTSGCSFKVSSMVEGIGTKIALILFAIAFFEIAGLILSVFLNNTWNNEERRKECNHEASTGTPPTAPMEDF